MIRSILNDVLDKIREEKDINRIKQVCIDRIRKSRIKKKDKETMIEIISSKKDYFSLIKAVYDLILKYEGYGVINKV